MNSFDNNKQKYFNKNKNTYSENNIENKYSLSLKYPLLFDITANQTYNIDYKNLINNAYKYYKDLYNINDNNLVLLINYYEFKKDTQLLYIAIHNSTTRELKNLEEYVQVDTSYKDIFENIVYDLHKLYDLSDNIVNFVHNIENNVNKIDDLQLLLQESEKLIKKYY